MNPDAEVSSKTSLSQNTHKEGLSRGTTDTNLAGGTEAENTAKGKTLGHASWRKEDDDYADFKQFPSVPKHDAFKWDLPVNLPNYTNDHFNKSFPEKNLEEDILVENPIPLNLHPTRKMDEFMRDLIFEKRAGSLGVAADSNLVKLQQKLLDVMGPLSKVWTIIEKAKKSASGSLITCNSGKFRPNCNVAGSSF